MEGEVISNPLCSFCYKSTASFDSDGNIDEEKEDRSLIPNFIQLTQTYFGKGLSHGDVSKLKLRSCQDCRFVIESFSTMCKKLMSLEKKVKERLLILKNVMSSADKVKSRVKAYGRYSKRDRGGKMIQEFRKDFVDKCSQHFSKPPQTPPEATKLTKKKEAQVAPLSTVISNILKDVPRSERTSIFHSLVSSFIILLLGVNDAIPNESTSVLPELDDLSNDLDDCLITCTEPKPEPATSPLIINLDENDDDGNLRSYNQTVVIHQSEQSESSRTEKTDYKVMLKPLSLSKGAAKKRKFEILTDSSTDSSNSDSSSSEEEPESDEDDPDFETTSVSRKTQFQCRSCKKPFKEKKSLDNHQRTCGGGSASSSRGRPSKRGRRSMEAEYEATTLRGSGSGTSPWQVNLMRVIGALHK